jgi:hypothetical protein
MKKYSNSSDTNDLELLQLDKRLITDPHVLKSLSLFSFDSGMVSSQDDPITHQVNSHGYRGKELGPVDLVTAGCSQTFGVGVEEPHIWPTILAKKLGLSHVNLGTPGGSTQSIVETTIKFISDFGKPKIVCLLLPDLYRFRFVVNSDVLTYSHRYTRGESILDVDNLSMIPEGSSSSRPSFSKVPHDVVDVVPYEAAVYLSMMSLRHLIEYCKIGGIQLVFSTWSPGTALYFEKMAEFGVIPTEYEELNQASEFYYESFDHHLCHVDGDNPGYWDVAIDTAKHMGAHQHLHFAELFEQSLTRRTYG